MDQRKADVRQKAGFGDDTARFLRELRQLRDGAGLGHAELAARAHYPYDSIRAAEVGPALPDLPVLAAFVKGCGGTTEEWEERWRSLTRTPSLPVSTARLAGNSAAATAGARIGSSVQEGETPDPSLILAALDRVAEEMAAVNGEPAAAQSPTEVAPAGSAAGSPAASAAGSPAASAAGSPAGSLAGDLAAGTPRATDLAADAGTADSGTGGLGAGGVGAGGVGAGGLSAGGTGADPDAADPDAGALKAADLGAGDPDAGKPAGWDPIRVSSAWPVLPASPRDAGTAGNVRAASGSGRPKGTRAAREASPAPAAPWTAAPWGDNPAGSAGRAGVGISDTGEHGGWLHAAPGAAPAAARGARPAPGLDAEGADGSAAGASRARVLVVCAVLLCVIAVVLAVFL